MPYYVYRGYDAPHARDLRDRLRPVHREHLKDPTFGVEAIAGGMLMSDDGMCVIGSMIVVRADDRAQVARFVEADPYTQGNVFNRTEILRWDWGFGLPAGNF